MPKARNYRGQRPRQLTDEDIAWFEDTKLDKPLTMEDVKALLRQRNPVRWWRLQNDFKWMQRQLRKMGRNPEDARWLF
jgi:hypothetical protein